MWTCTKCERIFEKVKQIHSCNKISLELHFENKNKEKVFKNCFEINSEEKFDNEFIGWLKEAYRLKDS